MQNTTERKGDLHSRITAQIVEYLEKGVRPWTRPWNAEHAAGRITRPLRFNGQPYSGINVLSLWMSALRPELRRADLDDLPPGRRIERACPQGREGLARGIANSIMRDQDDDNTGEDIEREIPFLKGYTVFNVEQIDGFPEIYYAKAEPTHACRAHRARREILQHFPATFKHGGNRAYYAPGARLRADADHRSLPRRRKLLRHPRA